MPRSSTFDTCRLTDRGREILRQDHGTETDADAEETPCRLTFHVGYVLPPGARTRTVPVVFVTAAGQLMELGRFSTDLQSRHACIVLEQIDLKVLRKAMLEDVLAAVRDEVAEG